MAHEDQFKYYPSSAPGTPSHLTPGTPRNSEKKIKNGLKKLIPFTKNNIYLDKSENGFDKEEVGGSPSRRRHFNLFKRHRSHKLEQGAYTTKTEEHEPENNEKTQNPSEKNEELTEKDRPKNEPLKEKTEPRKHNLHAETTLGEVLNIPERGIGEIQNHTHKQTQIETNDKGKAKEHHEPKVVVDNAMQEKEVAQLDHHHNHQKQNEDYNRDTKDERPVVASESLDEQSRVHDPPPPPPPPPPPRTKFMPRNEGLKEEIGPSSHDLAIENLGEAIILLERPEESQHHPHKQIQATNDDKGKSQGKEAVKCDQQNHHKQTKDHEADAKDETPVGKSEVAEEQNRDLGSPPPPLVLHEDAFGCQSLVKGLLKICLPWTINKEDH